MKAIKKRNLTAYIMIQSLTKHEKNLSAVIHASTFSKFLIPFGNFIVPLVLWTANKQDSEFVDYNGKQALNFQLSLLLYSIILGMLTLPFFLWLLPNVFSFDNFSFFNFHDYNTMNLHFNVKNFFRFWIWPIGLAGFVQGALFVVNLVYTILATLRTNEGKVFKYPITINFIK